MVQQNQKIEKQRRMLFAFPVLVLPFITLIFWALGGGSGNQVQGKVNPAGFNAELPGAKNKEEPLDKMGFYTQAEKDALEKEKQQKNDPYYNAEPDSPETLLTNESFAPITKNSSARVSDGGSYDPDEKQVYEKLNQLQRAINQPPETITPPMASNNMAGNQVVEGDLKQLQDMMDRMNNSTAQEDPQMKQAGDLLESILDLQHPERVQQRIKKASEENRGNVYAVSASQSEEPIGSLGENQSSQLFASNGFFGLDNPGTQLNASGNTAINAVVHETQTLVNGSTIKLRLIDPVYINGVFIPKDQFVFGVVSLSGERLNITITSIRNNNQLFPVELNVYDMDGLAGIYIPGAITRDVAKQGGERSIQGFSMASLDPSLGAQAANAGMEITRNLLSKKIKLVKVMVKAGYRIMLLDEKQNKNK
ncbi:conjugative transposon protein TraM [Pedobacter insulae]|uniref:Bacteroides conjugative transposon TraM protein n=1 Tax=Pedobacter insulae TaxID=414048 RepID=A0A1I2ZJG4_9SPHI|nr:conjugative transposon protein TraM [Pedobacter insulae]SFH37987.1 Bacteroides conjugative transposon TraM protein [Pedobacter insulae]